MFWFEFKLVATAVWSTALLALGIAQVANDWLTGIPVAGFGVFGLIALIWKLVRDNKADDYLRSSFMELVQRERERADRAEKRAEEAENRARDMFTHGDDGPYK